jgi:catechol 2,3-dioxygenase-like lactoylglutathione lyase family enzyme
MVLLSPHRHGRADFVGFDTTAGESYLQSTSVQLFHYHLVTSKVREVEARYVGKLGFSLVARHGRIGEDLTSFEAGVSWADLDESGFKLRLTELERGAVNIVIQPGQWPLPRVDHLGLVLDEDELESALARAAYADLRVQEHGGRRTFVSTNAGYRLELHPPRDWIEELLAQRKELSLRELELRADDPSAKAAALASILDLDLDDYAVRIGGTIVRFVPGGPQGRPELHGELFG